MGLKEILLNINIDFKQFISYLKTENLLKLMQSYDPIKILTNPYFFIPAIFTFAVLFFFNFRKLLVFLIGIGFLWYTFAYYLPKDEIIHLNDILYFSITCVLILAFWIYFFFIRAD